MLLIVKHNIHVKCISCVQALHLGALIFWLQYQSHFSTVFFRFFKELEGRHQRNILIEDISDIVEKHAKSTFDPYVKYCTNEVYQQRTLQKLMYKFTLISFSYTLIFIYFSSVYFCIFFSCYVAPRGYILKSKGESCHIQTQFCLHLL